MANKKGKKASTTTGLSAETIIVGFTGSIGSGCTYIAEGLESLHNYKRFTLSDVLRDIAKSKGITSPTIEDLQNIGNELRREEGNAALALRTIDIMDSEDLSKYKGVIIDSIRNDGEVNVLKQFPYFYLFSIHADEDMRMDRTIGTGKKFKSAEEFHKADNRDKAEGFSFGQQVEICNDLSDVIINNNIKFPKANKTQKKDFIRKIHNDYISVIETMKSKGILPERRPTADETLMTMAYAESQRSSCLKRKVGCIIASVNNYIVENENAIRESVQVISSGHNEVPAGLLPCIFTDYEKCHRDYLQEKQAKKINNCPNCGKKIKIRKFKCNSCNTQYSEFVRTCPKCKNEIEFSYSCTCGKKVFKEYLLSGGKLLDMCRSLHAEENALMYLLKSGSLNSEDIVLYTTTYPCNLCANKIATAGIKKVVYADPYPMSEAKATLKASGVETVKFQGIKSSAYFRFYR